MNDDELLDRIARGARAERQSSREAGWEELCDGTADLTSLDDRMAEQARDKDLLRPFDDLKVDAWVGIAERGLAGESLEGKREAVVVPFPRRRVAAVSVAAAGLAAAAAFAVWLSSTPSSHLPPYHLASASGDVAMRSDDAGARALELSSGGRFEIIIRPRQAIDGPVAARVFMANEGRITPLAIQPEISPQGVVRVRGLVDEAALAVGAIEFAVVVGRPDTLPTSIQGLDATDRDWQVVVVPAHRVR